MPLLSVQEQAADVKDDHTLVQGGRMPMNAASHLACTESRESYGLHSDTNLADTIVATLLRKFNRCALYMNKYSPMSNERELLYRKGPSKKI